MYSLLLNSIGLASLDEKYFSLLLVHGPFERRLYQKAVMAKLSVPKKESLDFAAEFKALQEYANGNNFRVDRICPVGPMCIDWVGERNEIYLVLPFNNLGDHIPGPVNRSIHFDVSRPKHYCSLRFRGELTTEIFQEKKDQLLKWIEYKGLEPLSEGRVVINTPESFLSFFKTYDIQIEVK